MTALGPGAATRGRVPALLGTIAACVLLAGCGGSAPQNKTGPPTFAGQQLAFSKCMRGHGVPGFPDPGAGPPAAPENTIGGIAIPTTINMQSPAFRAAMANCRGLLSAGFSAQGKPPITASMREALIAQAQCMRTHGVPGYQDPTFPAAGGISFTDAGTDPNSPAYKRAATTCGKR